MKNFVHRLLPKRKVFLSGKDIDRLLDQKPIVQEEPAYYLKFKKPKSFKYGKNKEKFDG